MSRHELLADQSFLALARRILAGRCVLFLGAGASISSGAPSGGELAGILARDVLLAELPDYGLGDVVDIAAGTVGRPEVDKYIVDLLKPLQPSDDLRQFVTLPWRAIYSVNFDDLVEKAYERDSPGNLRVFSAADELEALTPSHRPLYLLHGSIRRPNDRRMGLVLTQDDFTRALSQRRAFYHQLTDDMQGAEVVYVGFSLNEPDFRSVVDELHESVEHRQDLIPRGYALLPNPPGLVRNFWDTKKISLVASTLEMANAALAELRSGATVAPIPIGQAPALPRFLGTLSPVAPEAEDFLWAFEFPELDEGEPDPVTFLRGGPATWATIRENYDIARSPSDDLLVQLLASHEDEPVYPAPGSAKFILLAGHAGSGKSTAAKRAAWDLASTWGRCVVWVRHPSRLQLDLVESLLSYSKRRAYVFVDDGADAALQVVDVIRRARRKGLRATFIVVERANEWKAATQDTPLDPDRLFELGRMTDEEAGALVEKLEQAHELGNLHDLNHDERISRLIRRADRQLLVALREATEDKRFDEIIENELKSLPSESARRAYVTVATLYQFGVATRAGVLSRTTGIPFTDFGARILGPSVGVILEDQRAPWEQPSYVARHRVIAEIVFRRAFRSSTDRAEQVITLLRHLDSGYREDRRAFSRLIHAKWLRDNSIEPEDQEMVYSTARRLRPGDPFVVQQHALAWRYRDPTRAGEMLREAALLAPNDESIRHSQAVLLLDAARDARGSEQSELFGQAEEEFRRLIKIDPANSAPYVSLTSLLLAKSGFTFEAQGKIALMAQARKTLDIAFDRCTPTSFLLDMDARFETEAGNLDAAEEDYRKAADAAGGNRTLWINYSRFLAKHRNAAEAARVLNSALDMRPTDPALNYELARQLQQIQPRDDPSIRQAYEYAVAEPVRGYLPELDYAIYLDQIGDHASAESHFAVLRQLPIPYRIKAQPRAWNQDAGHRTQFDAVLSELRFRSAYVAVAGFPSPIFVDLAAIPRDSKEVGRRISVFLHYNCFGIRAVPTSFRDTESTPENDVGTVDVEAGDTGDGEEGR